MFRFLPRRAATALLAALCLTGSPDRSTAQSYPIDCAILLCLAGGWPASAPCMNARAEFTRRITPWPVEPPLQIWRCPMAATYGPDRGYDARSLTHDIMLNEPDERARGPLNRLLKVAGTRNLPIARADQGAPKSFGPGLTSSLVNDRADIDISGPEFDFVRSIKVYHVRQARQRWAGPDAGCIRFAVVVRGTYGTQGGFGWRPALPRSLPRAHVGLERWGHDCPGINHRSVFVEWRDVEGHYGFEQVDY